MAQRTDRDGEERRQGPRFEAAELGVIAVRLIGAGDVQLINFSERGLLFQSETRLLVGARATLRIAHGGDTLTAAGTVVRSLVQGLVGGKLQFRTAVSLDQPLPLVAGLARDCRSAETLFESAPPGGSETEDAGEIASACAETSAPATGVPLEPAPEPDAPPSDAESEPTESGLTPLSVLFVAATSERTAHLRARLADQPTVTLETRVQATMDELTRAAAERDVILFDSALGPDALARVVTALRATPIGAALVLLVSGAELPPDIVALVNGCVADAQGGDALAGALRDAAWTPWQPAAAPPRESGSRDGLYLRVFDALPVPVIVVNQAGRITVANISASRRLTAPGEELLVGRTLASMLAPGAAGPLADLLEAAFDGRQGQPLTTALIADDLPVALRPISLVPGAEDAPELAIRCETRLRPVAAPRRPVDEERTVPAESAAESDVRIAALEADLAALRATAAALERDLAAATEWRRGAEAAAAAAERAHGEALAALRAERDSAHDQSLVLIDEIGTARTEIAALRDELAARDAGADAGAVVGAETERLVRTLTSERDAAIARALQLTTERDAALDRVDAERTRADSAVAELSAIKASTQEPAAAAARRGRKLLADPEPTLPAARLQRMVDDLRAELRSERESRKELEQQLDENAEALERTIQSYESKLEAAERRAGTPARKPRKTA